MKRLDQLTREDLLEEHDRMLGLDMEDGVGELPEGFDMILAHEATEELIEAEEQFYEQRNRHKQKTQEDERRKTVADASRQPHYWQDHGVPEAIRTRVWRPTAADKGKSGKDKLTDE